MMENRRVRAREEFYLVEPLRIYSIADKGYITTSTEYWWY
jgi:hypothetical protein